MGKSIGKYIEVFILLLIGGCGIVFLVALTGSFGNVYTGEETFVTLEEAQNFQTKIFNEALESNVEVNGCSIDLDNPFKVTYAVHSPNKEFEYGKVRYTKKEIETYQMLFGGAGLVATIMFVLLVLAPKKEEG